MATKKAAEEVKEEVKAEEAAVEPVKEVQPGSAWDEYEDLIVPRKPKGEDQQFYVCVNDRRFAVPANGKSQRLPKPVAEILKDAIDAEYKADEFAENIPNRDPIQQNNDAMERIMALEEQIRQLQMQ